MPLLDLKLVTQMLIDLITKEVSASEAWGATVPDVRPLPPDLLHGVENAASLYLYHIAESTDHRNMLRDDPIPVQASPFAVNLHYVLSPQLKEADTDVLTGQTFMGLAMKALRDFAMIDDSTRIAGEPLLANNFLEGNRIKIVAQRMPPERVFDFWQPGDKGMRLAAYYQVGVVMLEPRKPAASTQRVLQYRTALLPGPYPVLEGTSSQSEVVLPDGTTEALSLAPAHVPDGAPFAAEGRGLVEPFELRLRTGDKTLVADDAWQVGRRPQGVHAVCRATASGEPVLPGVYGLSVRVRADLPAGPASNGVPLVVLPAATAPQWDPTHAAFRIDGGWFAEPGKPDASQPSLSVLLDGQALERTPPTDEPSLTAGTFAASPSGRHLWLLPPQAPNDPVRITVRVNEVESLPTWAALVVP